MASEEEKLIAEARSLHQKTMSTATLNGMARALVPQLADALERLVRERDELRERLDRAIATGLPALSEVDVRRIAREEIARAAMCASEILSASPDDSTTAALDELRWAAENAHKSGFAARSIKVDSASKGDADGG